MPFDDLPPVSGVNLPALALAPERIGPYRVQGLIGRGGMGVVYRAEQDRPERPVALKVLPADRDTPALRRRFDYEAAALGRLSHPGIAQVYHAGVADTPAGRLPYFAMELVDGVPLTEFADVRRLDFRARLGLVIQVCDAVQHAHQQGVVHRDLKPANILVTAEGRAKVLDFGVAKLTAGDTAGRAAGETAVGDVVGTLEYMSPEQAGGNPEEVDSRADVYAIGAILYELLANRRPLDLTGLGPADRLAAVASADPTPLGTIDRRLRGDLQTIVGKAMGKDKGRRYPAASELAADLRRYLADEPVQARPPSALYILSKFARKRRPLVAGTAAVTLAALLVAAVAVWSWADRREQKRQREAAEQLVLDLQTQDLLARGRWREAIDLTELVLPGRPNDRRLRLRQIRAFHALGDQRAIPLTQTLSARSDLSPAERAEVELWQGELFLMRGEQNVATRHFQQALAGELQTADREYLQALLAGSLDVALRHLRTALVADANHHGARSQLTYLLVFSGRWAEAETALAVGEAVFPNEPSFAIVRVLFEALRGGRAPLADAVGRLRPTLGEAATGELLLAAETLRAAFADSSRPVSLQATELFTFQMRLTELASKLSPSAGSSLRSPVMPPVFAQSVPLLQQAPLRARDRTYAAALGDAARSWPDAILYKAWGDTLLIQRQYPEAAAAFEAAMSAHSAFPAVIEAATSSHMLTLMTMYQSGDAATRDRIRPRLLDDVRNLAARYRGDEAQKLARLVVREQSLGWVMTDIAWQCGNLDLARAVLSEWVKVEPNSPALHAEQALVEFSARVYDQAIESAREALRLGVKDPILKGNLGHIVKTAPAELQKLAEKYPNPPPERKLP